MSVYVSNRSRKSRRGGVWGKKDRPRGLVSPTGSKTISPLRRPRVSVDCETEGDCTSFIRTQKSAKRYLIRPLHS